MNKKVSIIIPVYNAEKTILRCIESIINQSYKNIEIITIDDGSKDNSSEIIEKIKDKRIIHTKKQNEGVSKTRNQGINKSSGEYLIFVDADDYLENDMIEKMVKTIEEKKVDVVRCSYFYEKNNDIKKENLYNLSNKLIKKSNYNNENVLEHFLYAKEPIKNFVMLLLIRKKILIDNKILFDTNLWMMEDVVFYQELLNKIDSIYFLNLPLYHYIENPNSTTNSPEKYTKMIEGILATNKKLKEFIEKNKLELDLKMIDSNHFRIINIYINNIYKVNKYSIANKIVKKIFNVQDYKKIFYNISHKSLRKKEKLQYLSQKININFIKFFLLKIISMITN